MIICNGSGRTLEIDEDEYLVLLDQVLVDEEGLWLGSKEQWIKEAQELGQNPGYIVEEEDDWVIVLNLEDDNEIH